MKKFNFKWLLLSIILSIASINTAWAEASWIGKSFIVFNGTWYNGSGSGQSAGAFNDKTLGNISSLNLGGEVQTYGQSDGSGNPARMYYEFDSGSASYITLAWLKYADNNNYFQSTSNSISISDLTAGNHTLSIWFFQPDGEQYDSNSSNNYVATITVNPLVTFKANGGTGDDYTQRVTYNTSTALTACTFSRSGYAFAGWATASDGDVVYADGANVTLTAHTNLFAKWTAEETHDVTVSYMCGTATIKDATTESGVGVTTTRNVTAPVIDGYTFSSWTVGNGIKNNSADTTTNSININTKGSGSYTLTANYTAKACKLSKFSAAKDGTETDKGAMTFDATTKAYYKDITTDASPFYFRFYYNGATYYSTDWAAGGYNSGKTVAANGSKVDCDQSVGGWTNKPSIVFSGLNSSAIRIWFDYQAKKVWITETTYSVTVNNGDHGTVSPNGSQSVGKNSGKSITATPATGWKFASWSKTGSAVLSSTSTNPTTVTATGTGTVTPTYAHRFILRGSVNADGDPAGGMAGWSASNNSSYTSSSISDGVMTIVATLTQANTQYKCKIYDLVNTSYQGQTGTGEIPNNTAWTLNGSNDVKFTTTSAGTYTFTYNCSNASFKVVYPTSYEVTLKTKSFYNEGASSAVDSNGGTVSAVDNNSAAVTDGTKVQSGSTVTFTASPKTGYTFEGWYTESTCTTAYDNDDSDVSISGDNNTVLALSSIGANKTVYAKFAEKMTTVAFAGSNGHVEISSSTVTSKKVGKHTTYSVTAVPNTGYYFAGWTRSADPDFQLSGYAEANNPATLSGLGGGATSGQTLTANFTELEKIYFRNEFKDGETVTTWSDVYVYFHITWVSTNQVHSSSTASHIVHMTQITGTNVWWAYVPRDVTYNNYANVAFSNHQFSTNTTFSGYKAACRGDYNRLLNMFVPHHTKKETANSTDYYSNGYWMKYDTKASTGAGYYFKQYNSRNDYTQKGEFIATNDDATFIQFKLRIDAANTYRGYMITSAGGLNYVADDTITAAKCTNVGVSENTSSLSSTDVKFMLLTTSEGEYTFILDQSGDKMKLSVIYPVTVGDYILENAYTDGSAKTTHSNIIKAADAATKTRYSMFLSNKGAGATLKLRKCTAVSAAGVPTWSEGDETKLSSILSDGKFTPGVYQFDITIADDKVATIDSVRLYTGDFYIKTDAAPGGWITYTQNIMDKNTVTFDRTSATFDNYWCHYYSTDADNIKCVIANDYCNQLSDTLKGDDISRMSGTEPYVPKDKTSIRFSYNSATNTIARAYLKSQDDDDYLDIEPFETGYVYNTSSEDLKGAGDNKRRFTDNGDWIYEKDLKVYPGAKAGVSATYKDASGVDHVQTLLPTSNTVLGGTKGENQYDIRVVYDFKTNYMMSSFILPKYDEIEDNLTDVDMLWVRHKDESADQLLLGDGISLSKVSVVGAIELKYNEMNKNSTSGSKVDLSEWNETSRPYLKYFISFPFEVPVNSIFGLNQAELGREYIIQKYNGAKRAKEGLFGGDDDNYWENLTKDSVMHANEGYCVIFDNDYARGLYGHIWDNKSSGSSVYLYFPAKDTIKSITNSNQTILVDSLHCRVNRAWANNAEKNHMQTDSHWHLIGSPLFHDSYIKSRQNLDTFQLRSYYKLDYSDNKWKAQAITEGSTLFKAMSSVMVQWYGKVTWTTEAGPYTAPTRTSAPAKNYLVQLDLSYNGNTPDWTYVQLREDADDDFVLREDMYKMYNSGIPQIYTFAGAYDVAYNGVPEKNQTIPVGVLIRKNGTYTFSMPTTFSGTVTLIDTFEQTRTDLSITDYTVELEKGTINDRFLLEINIHNVITSLENENGSNVLNDGGVHKFIKNDNMYILRNGVIYDAQGRKVE